MRYHDGKTVSSCFAILRHLPSIRRSVTRPLLRSIVVSHALSRLDFGITRGIPAYSVVPSSATSVGIECSRQADILVVEVRPHQPAALPTSPIASPIRSQFWRTNVNIVWCLRDELRRPADTESRRRLYV